MPGYSPKYPLTFSPSDGYYEMNKTIFDAIKQNVRNLVLTNPGERIMDVTYGVGISRFLFEMFESGIQSSLVTEIQYQFGRYIPQVTLVDVDVQTSEDRSDIGNNGMRVKIVYLISAFGITDNITITETGN